MAADKPQQILLLSFILRKCRAIGLNKSESSFSTVIDDLEELDLGLQSLVDGGQVLECRKF